MRCAALVFLVSASACEASGANGRAIPADSWLAGPREALPETLEEVGLYLDPADLSIVPDTAVAYSPRWPLWSGGSEKVRHVVLPEGTAVDNADEAWTFPVGTAFFKTFGYPREGVLLPVETRVMYVEPDGGWAYADYGWDAEGQSASLLDITFPTEVEVQTDAGLLTHTIPATLQCRECHEAAPTFVLGFEALQLGEVSAELDVDFSTPLREVPPLPTDDVATQDVLGLFVGQCVHCHNGFDGPASSFDLRPAVALANTIGRETESSAAAAGIRIVPGDPEGSALFEAFSGETDDPEVNLMPPLGIDRRDTSSIELLRGWIAALPSE